MKKKIWLILLILTIIVSIAVVVNNRNNNIGTEGIVQEVVEEIELPAYIESEIQNAEKRIEEIAKEDNISFSYITDLHAELNIDTTINNIQAFRKINANKFIDFGVCAGDTIIGKYEDFKTGKAATKLQYYSNILKETKTQTLFARGNHDCNTRTDANVAISGEKYYELILKSLGEEVVFNNEDLGGNYYYKDLEEKQIRICVLNAFNGENYEFIFGKKQLDFVKNKMLDLSDKSNPDEWQVLFISHTVEETNAHDEVPKDKQKLFEIINEFQNLGGTVIAIITGHHHLDSDISKNGILIITVRSASVQYDRENYNTETFTADDVCFDIFTIDKESKTLYATRVGRGNDRKWNYDINNL